jgi:hypothetical protein
VTTRRLHVGQLVARISKNSVDSQLGYFTIHLSIPLVLAWLVCTPKVCMVARIASHVICL